MSRTLLIGTPAHKPEFPGTFYECLNQTERACAANGVRSWWVCAKGCGVEWNRNKLVSVFLESEATHLLFVDTDMAWSPKTVLRWLEADREIVAGAALARRLDRAQWNVQPTDPPSEVDADGYVRVSRAGTGLMMIRRDVLARMYTASDPYYETYEEGRKPLRRLFYFDIDPETREMRGEDFNFCRDAQDLGYGVWCDTDARLGHITEVPISAGLESLLPALHIPRGGGA